MRIGLTPETDRAVFQLVKARGLSREQVRSQPMVVYRDYRLGRFEGPQPLQLQYVGGLITDDVRYLNDEGDGLGHTPSPGQGMLPPPGGIRFTGDSSVGVWQACNFNYHNNSGAETADSSVPPSGFNQGDTNHVNISSVSAASAGISAKFGSRVFEGDVLPGGDGVTCRFAQEATLSGTDPAGKVWTSSVWVNVPVASTLIGKSFNWVVQEIEGGTGNGNLGTFAGTFVQGWQRLTLTYTTVAANIDNLNCSLQWTGTAGEIIFTDGWQLEPNPIATPYVLTWPDNRLARAAGSITAPSAILDPTQGWIALRLRPGFASTASTVEGSGAANPHVFSWMTAVNTEVRGYYELSTDTFLLRRASGTVNVIKSGAQSFAAGSSHTVVYAWEAGLIKVSVDGAAFVVDSTTQHIPSGLPTTVALGAKQDSADGWFNGDFVWVLAGTGVISNTDAAAINAYGDAGPATPYALELGTPADFYWPADTATWWTPTVGAYAESGAGITGGAAAGADSFILNKSGWAAAGTVATGPSESLVQETGFGQAAGVASGQSAWVKTESGVAVAGTFAAGADVDVDTETGFGKAGTFAAGGDNFLLNKTGAGVAGSVAAGDGVVIDADGGFAKAGTFASGFDNFLLNKTGAAVANGVASGADVDVDTETGYATVGGVGAGASESLTQETGFAAADANAYGADNFILNKTGSCKAGTFAAGVEAVTLPTVLVDTFTRTLSNQWGTADSGQSWTVNTAAAFSTDGAEGVITPQAANTTYRARIALGYADFETFARFRIAATPTGASSIAAFEVRWDQTAGTGYATQLTYTIGGSLTAALVKRTPSNVTIVSAVTIATGLSGGEWFRIRYQAIGSTVQAKVWQDGTSEPSSWTLSGTDTAYSVGGIAVTNFQNTGGSNLPAFQVDEINVNVKVESGYATAGGVGAGQENHALARSGYADVDGDASGSRAVIHVRSGFADADGDGYGSSAWAKTESGFADADANASGSRAADHLRPGYADADGDAYGSSAWVKNESGWADIAGVAGGASASTEVDTGFADLDADGYGSRAIDHLRAGYADVDADAFGSRAREVNRTGFADVAGVGAGVSEFISGAGAVYAKAGFADVAVVAAGVEEFVDEETGFADADGDAFGSRAVVHVRSGYADADGDSFGSSAWTKNESGYADVAAFAAGTDEFADVDSGYADVAGVGAGSSASVDVDSGYADVAVFAAGSDNFVLNKTGYATVGTFASSSEADIQAQAGYADVAAAGSGADVDVFSETGFGDVAGVSAGVAEASFAETGYADVDGDASASRAVVHVRSGYADVTCVASGADADTFTETGFADAGAFASGTSSRGATFQKTGYADVAGVASAADVDVDTDTGYADVAAFAFGSSESIFVESGFGDLAAVASGADADVFSETGYADVAAAAFGSDAFTDVDSGYADIAGVAAAASASVFVESGSGVCGTVASGADADVLNRSGYADVDADGSGRYSTEAVTVQSGYADLAAVASGADVVALSRHGYADTDADASGTRSVTHIKRGYADVKGVASGTSFRFAEAVKAGYAKLRALAFGQSASITQETGYATVDANAYGTLTSTRAPIVKAGYADASTTSSGEKVQERNRYGHAVAGLIGAGRRTSVYTESGVAILEGTGSGVREISVNKTGWADVAGSARGSTEFHKFKYPAMPPGDLVRTLIGSIMENADGGLSEPGEGVLTGSGRGHLSVGGKGRIKETV